MPVGIYKYFISLVNTSKPDWIFPDSSSMDTFSNRNRILPCPNKQLLNVLSRNVTQFWTHDFLMVFLFAVIPLCVRIVITIFHNSSYKFSYERITISLKLLCRQQSAFGYIIFKKKVDLSICSFLIQDYHRKFYIEI